MPNITFKPCYYLFILTHKRSVIFTCTYFKLSRNTTALSQSNCWNFSCSSIKYTNTSFHKNQQCVEFKLEKLLAQSERKYIYPSEVNWRGQKSRMVRRFKWDHFSTTLCTCYCLLWVPLCRTIYLVRSSNFWFCGWTPVALPILFNGAVCFSGFYKIQCHISRASISKGHFVISIIKGMSLISLQSWTYLVLQVCCS